MTLQDFQRIIRGSMRYEFDNYGRLTVVGYYSGGPITIDLMRLSEEAFEDILVEDEDDDV